MLGALSQAVVYSASFTLATNATYSTKNGGDWFMIRNGGCALSVSFDNGRPQLIWPGDIVRGSFAGFVATNVDTFNPVQSRSWSVFWGTGEAPDNTWRGNENAQGFPANNDIVCAPNAATQIWANNDFASASRFAVAPERKAFGSFLFAANPANGNTITINGQNWSFAAAAAAQTTVIGANLAATLAQLANDLNAQVTGSRLAAPPSFDDYIGQCEYWADATHLYVRALKPGLSGNNIPITNGNSGANVTASGATLAGGTLAGEVRLGNASIGAGQGIAVAPGMPAIRIAPQGPLYAYNPNAYAVTLTSSSESPHDIAPWQD